MADHDPPLRLALDPAAPSALRQLLRQGQEDLPNQAALARLSQRLEPEFRALPVGPKSSAVKAWLVGGVTVAAVAVIAVLLTRRVPEVAPPAARAVPSSQVAAPSPSPVSTAVVEEAVAVPTSSSAASAGPASPQPSVQNRSAPVRPSEVELLERARRALASDPKRALTLTRQHQSLYPQGALRQEREVIAIEALRRLGAPAQASERAGSFEQRYPDSAHRRSVERGLQQ